MTFPMWTGSHTGTCQRRELSLSRFCYLGVTVCPIPNPDRIGRFVSFRLAVYGPEQLSLELVQGFWVSGHVNGSVRRLE